MIKAYHDREIEKRAFTATDRVLLFDSKLPCFSTS